MLKNFKMMLVALLALTGMVGAAQAAVIFEDSFETPGNSRNWQVYQNFGAWSTTSGRGIEIQRSGVVVTAHDGNQYVELDSDRRRGGSSTGPNNSAMTTMLNLAAGNYTLEYWYRPRTNRVNDNIINVFLDGASDSLKTNLIASSNAIRSQVNQWILQTVTFNVDGLDNNYGLTFAAAGRSNTLGGFIDSVSLTRNDVPAPAALGLIALGLAGLALSRRRRKA